MAKEHTVQQEKNLNQTLQMFQEMHGVTFTCSTVYTHAATSLKSDTTLLVLFQNQILSDQKLVDYATYKDTKKAKNVQVPLNDNDEVDKDSLPQ